MIGLEVESVDDKAQAARALHHRARDLGRAASERRPAARLHGRHRRGRSGAGRVRRAECAHRHEGRVRAARRLHPGQEHHARRRQHPRRREPRHAGLRDASCSSPTTTRASSTCPTTRRSARPMPQWAGLDDPVIEINLTPNRPDCTGVHGIARDLAAADMGKFIDKPRRSRCQGAFPCPRLGDARLRRDAVALPRLCAAARARREERPVARLAAEAAHRDRAAPDQCAGRHHQLHHLRPRPAAARVRRRQGARQSRRCAARAPAKRCSRSTARPTRSTRPCA